MNTSIRWVVTTLFIGSFMSQGNAKFHPKDLKIGGKSGIIIEARTGKVLWSKNPDVRRYPASTTKIMTSLVIREMLDLTDTLQAPADIAKIGGSSLHLKPLENLSVRDALYAILLRSANDVCHTSAIAISGTETSFASLMNEKAKELGCKNTHFNNPHGLPDRKHFTTARDLAIMGQELLKDEFLASVVKTKNYQVSRSINKLDTALETRNKWLLKDVTADGIKTGFTNDAGHCYVGSATREDFQIITVILNSENTQIDQKAMLDWAYGRYALALKEPKGTEIASVLVRDGDQTIMPVKIDQDAKMIEVDGLEPEIVLPMTEVTAPIFEGQNLGFVKLRDSEGFELQVPIVAAKSIQTKSFIARLRENPAGLILLSGALCGAWFMRRRHRNF